jgi:hypothetical protein
MVPAHRKYAVDALHEYLRVPLMYLLVVKPHVPGRKVRDSGFRIRGPGFEVEG